MKITNIYILSLNYKYKITSEALTNINKIWIDVIKIIVVVRQVFQSKKNNLCDKYLSIQSIKLFIKSFI